MNLFVPSPLFENWIIQQRDVDSIIICSPFLKKEALERIITAYRLNGNSVRVNIKVLIAGRLSDFINGASDISALETLRKLSCIDPINVRRISNLHMKAFLINDNSLLIGSGNCTLNGLFAEKRIGNIEGAISTDDPNIISQFLSYFNQVFEQSEPLDIFYDQVVNEYTNYVNESVSLINLDVLRRVKKKDKFARFNLVSDRGAQGIAFENVSAGEISIEEIPQFSTFEHGAFSVVEILSKENDIGLTFLEMGRKLQEGQRGEVADRKYGENHSKLAELLDFTTITQGRPRKVFLTKLGKGFLQENNTNKREILKAQIYRMAIVKDIIDKHMNDSFSLDNYLRPYLKQSTINRRRPNIKRLFEYLLVNGVIEVESVLAKM
ncbi:MAG: hypothetical protein KGZ79_08990 [Dethiobacter sp.]|jgi:hypothetical protein|nr:hypothetical protein [Dethiobacter sp.]